MMVNVGFTGTQRGMTSFQKHSFATVWEAIEDNIGQIDEFHHGDCLGADKQAHEFTYGRYGGLVVIHPPDVDAKRAWCAGDVEKEPLPYLKRNQKIVDACDVLIATPNEHKEVLRSGTWATIRRARKKKKTIFIIYPDGMPVMERGDE